MDPARHLLWSWRPRDLFPRGSFLLDEVNGSAVQALFAANIGREISLDEVRTAFDAAFGSGAGDRVRLSCKRDGSRRLITEVTIGLAAQPGDSNKLADLI